MADGPGGEKTEKATPKKRRDQRKKGNVFTSKDVATLISFLAAFYGLKFYFPVIYRNVKAYLLRYLGYMASVDELSMGTLGGIGIDTMGTIAIVILPFLAIMAAVGVLSTAIQTRFLFTMESVKPKFSKLNPINGIKNLFSLKNLVELLKNLIKISILLIFLYNMIRGDLLGIARTIDMDLSISTAYTLDAVMRIVFQLALAFAVLAVFDYLYQHWDYERQLKMTKQEVKEEFKQTEGDPKVKGKIRDIQRQRARSRMMQAVPEADVVIRNPTHYAVALKYDIEKDNAPILVAKGQDELALRIVRVAEENDVYIVENKVLARALYASTPLDREIPQEFYGTVAEILVYVFKENHKVIL
ncbi:MAG: flagellar biosynthesis protein FlhB [Lachnospiraceae bacterium]|jgi:flagellar biosynthetic protein FlhB|nr:flagellar biosynthesis protein FlhB [Lachnospiraceae bacterium]MCI9470209.1 flagellar biosynthesis protein FlhB [Lachnospiraceae bacterium]